MIFSTR
nr:hypothetical protein MW567_pgp25 [Solanum aturense]YP_010340323.1 hypothetical chloroplast RF1 [Solanum aturense]UNZ92640.1 hypothetical protein [Solanum aturense]UNZ92648.1 hypothetical chloroplast RF1 [Solanum aturense]